MNAVGTTTDRAETSPPGDVVRDAPQATRRAAHAPDRVDLVHAARVPEAVVAAQAAVTAVPRVDGPLETVPQQVAVAPLERLAPRAAEQPNPQKRHGFPLGLIRAIY